MDALTVDLVTPTGRLFSGDASYVAVPAWDGEMGILPGHVAMVSLLGAGMLRIRVGSLAGRQERTYLVGGGIVQILQNRITLLVTEALTPQTVDREKVAPAMAETSEALRHPESEEHFQNLLVRRRFLELQKKLSR